MLFFFFCREDLEVDDKTGGPESTAGAMYTSEQGTAAEVVMAEEQMYSLEFLISKSVFG